MCAHCTDSHGGYPSNYESDTACARNDAPAYHDTSPCTCRKVDRRMLEPPGTAPRVLRSSLLRVVAEGAEAVAVEIILSDRILDVRVIVGVQTPFDRVDLEESRPSDTSVVLVRVDQAERVIASTTLTGAL